MANKEIQQIPFVASEVQNNRLERIINKLIITNIIQIIVVIGLLIYILAS